MPHLAPPTTSDLDTPAGRLPTGQRPVVMGIVNVTPDSFSDGGTAYAPTRHPDTALDHAGRLLADGADLVDVGGESTRPGARPVPAEVEVERVVPVVEQLARDGAIVSVDTSKASVARAALDAGAAMINDVSAGAFDPGLWDVVRDAEVPYVLMHLRGEPRTMQDDPRYGDVVAEVFGALEQRLAALEAYGVGRRRVVLDPGIGFGKTLEHNLALLGALDRLCAGDRPVLIGVSRKRFIGTLSGVDAPDQRVAGSLAAATLAVAKGARIVRTHDVGPTVEALRVAHAITTADTGRS